MPTAVETISLPVEAAPPNHVPTALFAATCPAQPAVHYRVALASTGHVLLAHTGLAPDRLDRTARESLMALTRPNVRSIGWVTTVGALTQTIRDEDNVAPAHVVRRLSRLVGTHSYVRVG